MDITVGPMLVAVSCLKKVKLKLKEADLFGVQVKSTVYCCE
jgi:hypothetical protein